MTAARLASVLIVLVWVSGPAQLEEFECDECSFTADWKPRDHQERPNCTRGWPFETETLQIMYRVVSCPTAICFLVFGSTWSYHPDDYKRDEHPYYSRGCSVYQDIHTDPNRINTGDTQSFSAYFPVPAPGAAPLPDGHFACRRNRPNTHKLTSTISCFCYTSRCTRDMDTVKNQPFYVNVKRVLTTLNDWVIVDSNGEGAIKSPVKSYRSPADLAREPFSCGDCPCSIASSFCTRTLKGTCPTEPYGYSVEKHCPSAKQCYLMFGDLADVPHGFGIVDNKGCGEATPEDMAEAKSAGGTLPTRSLYFANPLPETLPGPDQWICRRNPYNYNGFSNSMSCFCFITNCQTWFNPKQDEFRDNINATLPATQTWVLIDAEGKRVDPSLTTVPSATVPGSTPRLLVTAPPDISAPPDYASYAPPSPGQAQTTEEGLDHSGSRNLASSETISLGSSWLMSWLNLLNVVHSLRSRLFTLL